MKIIYAILALLSQASFAATPAGIPSVTVSASGANTAQVSITPSQLASACASPTGSGCFSLYAAGATGNNGYFLVLYKNGAAYATGATTKAYCFDITASGAGGSGLFQFASSQTSFANLASSIVSGTYQGGAPGNYPLADGPTALVAAVVPGVYTFGDGAHVTYAGVQTAGTGAYYIHLDCYEQ